MVSRCGRITNWPKRPRGLFAIPEADFQKRASGLVAFPRVGRGDAELRKWAHLLALQQVLDKRTGPSASSGLWFGPRLGKRSVDAKSFEDTNKGQKEFN